MSVQTNTRLLRRSSSARSRMLMPAQTPDDGLIWYDFKLKASITKDASANISVADNVFTPGTNQATQVVESKQPDLVDASYNNNPVANSDGVEYFNTTVPLDSSTNGGFVIMCVVSHGANTAGNRYIFDSFNSGDNVLLRIFATSATQIRAGYGINGGGYTASAQVTVPVGNKYYFVHRCRNGLQEFFVVDINSTLDATSPDATTTVAEDILLAGAQNLMSIQNGAAGSTWKGDTCEFLGYNRWLSDDELERVCNYNSRKWGS